MPCGGRFSRRFLLARLSRRPGRGHRSAWQRADRDDRLRVGKRGRLAASDIANVDGTGVKQLTWYTGDAHKPHVTASDSQPAISPDGTKVAFDRQSIYCRPDTMPACRPVKASANSPWAPGLRILDLSTRKMIKVNDSSILQYQWLGMRWTADSKWLLIEGSEDAGCPPVTAVPTGPQSGATNAPPATQPLPKGGCYVGVFRVSSNGRHVLRVTRQEVDPQAIESSDGRSVALANSRGIDTIDLKTQAVRHVLALPPSLSLGAFDWASDGRFMFTTIESGATMIDPGLWITDTSGASSAHARAWLVGQPSFRVPQQDHRGNQTLRIALSTGPTTPGSSGSCSTATTLSRTHSGRSLCRSATNLTSHRCRHPDLPPRRADIRRLSSCDTPAVRQARITLLNKSVTE